jgi:hypothetical protein
MVIVPITLKAANEFVTARHRHHKRSVGHKFSIGCSNGELRGVAICGRPVARMADDGLTLEVNRLCTDGTPNACSMLYGAARRVARELGYKRIITYTLPSEGGASLRASGWRLVGPAGGGSWNCPSRPREDDHPLEIKHRWEATL